MNHRVDPSTEAGVHASRKCQHRHTEPSATIVASLEGAIGKAPRKDPHRDTHDRTGYRAVLQRVARLNAPNLPGVELSFDTVLDLGSGQFKHKT